MKRSIIFLFGQIGLTGSFIRTIFIAFVFGITFLTACQSDSELAMCEKVAVLEGIDPAVFTGYQVRCIDETMMYPKFVVLRIPFQGDYSVIQIWPEPLVEKKFCSGDSIDISFVENFAKLDCKHLYITREFKRIDFYLKNQDEESPEKESIAVLFEGVPPEDQEFLLNMGKVKKVTGKWNGLIHQVLRKPKREQPLLDSLESKVPFVWRNYLCLLPEFEPFYFCDNSPKDLFEVVIMKDPIKGPLHILLTLDQGKIDGVYFARFHFTHYPSDEISKQYDRHLSFPAPVTNNMTHWYFDLPKKIKTRSGVDQLNVFFLEEIWKLPYEDCEHLIDPENWDVYGRKNGQKFRWTRQTFNDSIYYSNLQILLDLCGVEDFKYEGR